ncbi:TPA: NAD(P)-dependent oxidoreductase [Candidatus Woesearchaeota archaeon]|nr:NAD(P)-dependent oxidoreductase [Candidatus Woesearchaeota archaeon]
MNALVTGAGGWLGRCLVGKLIAKGHTVICIDLWPAQHPTPVLRSRKKNIRIVKGDIRRPERFIKEMRGCDAVFNCAGSQHPRWTSELYEINSLAPERVLRCCQKAGVPRLIHVSSSTVYGSNHGGSSFTEESPLRPLTHYARSKAKGDNLLLAPEKSPSTDVVIIRPAVFYSTQPSPNMVSLVNMVRARKAVLFGKRGFLRTYVDIRKVVDVLLLAQRKGERNGIYLVGDEQPLDTLSLYEALAEPMGVSIRPIRMPVVVSRLCEKSALLGGYLNVHLKYPNIVGEFGRDHVFSSEKAKRQLSYRPKGSSEEGLRTMAGAVAEARAGASG